MEGELREYVIQGEQSAFMNNLHNAWDTARDAVRNRLALGAAIAAGAVALAGCGTTVERVTTVHEGTPIAAANTANTNSSADACGTEQDFNKFSMNTNYGSLESPFPLLQKSENGQDDLLGAHEAGQRLAEQLADDPRALAIFTAFIVEPRADLQEPGTATLARAEQLMQTFTDHPHSQMTQDALDDACYLATTQLIPTNQFAVTKNQATEVQAEHDGNIVSGFKTVNVSSTELLSGYQIGYNDDDKNLSSQTKKVWDKLEDLILITGKGTLVINDLIGQGSFKIVSNAKHATHVKAIVTKTGQKVLVYPKTGSKIYSQPGNEQTSNNESGSTGSSHSTTSSNHNSTSNLSGNGSENTGGSSHGGGHNNGGTSKTGTGTSGTSPNHGGGGGSTTSTGSGEGTTTGTSGTGTGEGGGGSTSTGSGEGTTTGTSGTGTGEGGGGGTSTGTSGTGTGSGEGTTTGTSGTGTGEGGGGGTSTGTSGTGTGSGEGTTTGTSGTGTGEGGGGTSTTGTSGGGSTTTTGSGGGGSTTPTAPYKPGDPGNNF